MVWDDRLPMIRIDFVRTVIADNINALTAAFI